MAVRWGRGGLELDPEGAGSCGHRPASGDHPSLPSPCPGLFHSRSEESRWALAAGKALFPQF